MTPSERIASAGDGPLAGVRVVELSTTLLGPYCGQLLAEMDADVVKVESHGGDVNRHLVPGRNDGMSPQFLNFNAGKRSVALDLKDPLALEAMHALLATADVFLHNGRPEAVERLGLGPDRVRAMTPDVIYCCLTGFCSDSVDAGRPAYDDVIQAASGMAHLQGFGRTSPEYVVTALCDKAVGMAGVAAINAALFRRASTGQGDTIEVPMYDFMAGFVLQEQLGARTFEPPTGPIGYPRTLSADRRPYAVADGYISVVAITDAQWAALAAAIDRPAILAETVDESGRRRPVELEVALPLIEEALASRTVGDWLRILVDAGVPAAEVRSIIDVADDPDLRRRGVVELTTHPTEGEMLRVRHPTTFAGHHRPALRHAPRLGEHNEELLVEAGVAMETIHRVSGPSTVQPREGADRP